MAHPGPSRPRRPRRGPLLLLVAVLVTAVVGYAAWWLGVGRYTPTPGVINLSVKAATGTVEEAGLNLEVAGRRYSETVQAGSVISSDPEAGSRIVDGGTVAVIISKGPERYAVPRLRGRPLTEVTTLLEEENLTLGSVEEDWDEAIEEGLVVSASPVGGTELRRDSPVDIVVSKGPRPVRIPDLTGKRAAQAQEQLVGLGFTVELTKENSDEVPRGRVISQSPSEGRGFRGDTIKLVASKGPAVVEVPDLFRSTLAEAMSELAKLGLEISVERVKSYAGLDKVDRQSPTAGSSVPQGDTVTVFIV